MKVRVNWETDGQDVDLPEIVELPKIGVANCECGDINCEDNQLSITNYLSDKYGWLVNDYSVVEEDVKDMVKIPKNITTKVYYSIDKGKVVIDVEGMEEEFDRKVQDIIDKFGDKPEV